MGRSAGRHHTDRVAEDLRRAAGGHGVDLPVRYARRLAADGLAHETDLRVTRLGTGVIIQTAPRAPDRLPIVVGYADGRGQWHHDGRRHIDPPDPEDPAETGGVGV